ncbi:MAG: hypothetical protein ACTSR8_01515 [Promethearchaeota archaeon]
MTIYTFSVITSTGYPYYNLNIRELPKGIKLYLRFFDFTKIRDNRIKRDGTKSFELNAGLISALFEFAKNMDKKIDILEFTSRTEKSSIENLSRKFSGDVIITAQTESYLLANSVKQKVNVIYKNIISPKIPLDTANSISVQEEQKIIDILTDAKAREHIENSQKELKILAEDFLKMMEQYGLEGICITSCDLSPLVVYGKKYLFEDIEVILRNIGMIPVIEPLEWKYRQSFQKGNQVWVYLINSGIGVTVDGVFQPYFYLLFANPESYLAEFPFKLTSEFNIILG